MDPRYSKWVNLIFVSAGAVVAYVFYELFSRVGSVFDLETKIKNLQLVEQGLAFVLGAVAFVVLFRNLKATTFMNGVVGELANVTWPTQKETSSATVVVVGMVVISGAILGLLDYLWTVLIKWVL